MSETIRNLKLDKNAKILDIGTGFGAMAILLAINGFKVITGQPESKPEYERHNGTHSAHHDNHDYDDHRISSLDWKKNAKALGVDDKIHFQHFDAINLPFSNNSFDCIFMYDTLQHVQNRKKALNECLRVVKSGGFVGVIEWSKKAIDEDYEKYGFKIDFIDPRDLLKRDDISTEIFKSEFVIFYILQLN
ncbi:MAG: class I SAM-dependent methyltransferase [Promethearchaeota archaeon]